MNKWQITNNLELTHSIHCHWDKKFTTVSGPALLCSNFGQVIHTNLPLSPSSIIWYWPKGGDARWLGGWQRAWRSVMAVIVGFMTNINRWLFLPRYCDQLWHPCSHQPWKHWTTITPFLPVVVYTIQHSQSLNIRHIMKIHNNESPIKKVTYTCQMHFWALAISWWL